MEYALLVSIISVLFAIYAGVISLRRFQRQDDQAESAMLARVTLSLEHINDGITTIRHDVCEIKADIKEHGERIVKVEESSKQAHKRLDEMTARRVGL